MERVEIIKGPTSIIGGAVEPGGFVNRTVKTPLDENFTEATLQSGTFDLWRAAADANMTIGKSGAAVRLVALAHTGGEFVDDTDRDRYSLLPSIKFDIGDDTTITTFLNLQHEKGREYMGFPVYANGDVPDIPVDRFFGGTGGGYERDHAGMHVDGVHKFLDGLKLNAKAALGYSDYESRNIYAYASNGLPVAPSASSATVGAIRTWS